MNTPKNNAKKFLALIATALLAIAMLSGCDTSQVRTSDNTIRYNDDGILVSVEQHDDWKIVVDPDTRVEYIYHHTSIGYNGFESLSVRLDADGKPVIYEGDL